ncbi:outer membrane protein [Salmonella enterica subsp. salamae]|uniref:Outer membrane protein n=1 Tax=Salmonella enterica subsp. salamae TaxID=59202 RepID=A0A6D2G9D2_SALER|nr:outer membrane protein [Salmonella enterica subsp. salamae]
MVVTMACYTTLVHGLTYCLNFGNDSYEASDNFMTGRANGVLTYRNNDFFGLVDGLNFALQYQGKNDGLSKEGDPFK